MAHESFENEEVAAIMNREFVNIKVDREERPDVDRVYMTFVQATTGSGGWPMSVWLTPDLKPFVGGTYFPPEERYGQPAFTKVLERIATAWKEDHDRIVEQGSKIVEALRESQSAAPGEGKIDGSVLMPLINRSIGVMTRRKADSALRRNFPGQLRLISSRDFTHAIPRAMPVNTLSKWRCLRCAKWPRAECTITSAAGFIVTRLIVTGTCRTSRRCFTTRRSSRSPISTRSESQGISSTNQSRAISSITSLAT